MKAVFKDILSQNVDDAVIFDTESIRVEEITEFKEYHGIRISVIGYLDKTRISVGIDIGFGDVIYPNAVKMEFPVLLDMDPPEINVYSVESAIAEKLQAIISIGKKEIEEMIADGEEIHVNCHFCNRSYTFSVEDLKEMLKKSK